MTAPAKGPRSRFVEIPADRLLGELIQIGAAVIRSGGADGWTVQGRERVFHLRIKAEGPTPAVKVFTTLPVNGAAVRDCGKDAVRIVVGIQSGDRFTPTSKARKLLRTAPKGAEDRVQAFLDRLRDALRDAYKAAKAVRACPKCGKPMAQRKGPHGPFLGCTGYPACKATARVG